MLFKVGDILEYSGGYSAIVHKVEDVFIELEVSNGEKITMYKKSLILAITYGRVKFKPPTDNVKPQLSIKKHKI